MIRNKIHFDERAVSPVIGVILMVAITVILAAVIGTFVLGLGSSQSSNASASVSFDKKASGDVEATVVAVDQADSLTLNVPSSNSGCSAASAISPDISTTVGDTGTVTGCSDGDVVQVVGTLNGDDTVIQTYTY
jgi:flagellin-like protein